MTYADRKLEKKIKERAQLFWNIWARFLGYTFFCAIFSDRSALTPIVSLFPHLELFYVFLAIIGISVLEAVMSSTRWLGVIAFVALTATIAAVTFLGHTFAGDVWYLPFRFRMVMALVGGVSALIIGFDGRSMGGALLAFLLGQLAGVASCEAALLGARLFGMDLQGLMTNTKAFFPQILAIALATLPLAACNGIVATLADERKMAADAAEPDHA